MTLEYKLRELLTNFRYESLRGLGRKGLMEHHIDALMQELLPFIETEVARERKRLFVSRTQQMINFDHPPIKLTDPTIERNCASCE